MQNVDVQEHKVYFRSLSFNSEHAHDRNRIKMKRERLGSLKIHIIQFRSLAWSDFEKLIDNE
jgi:hypothetical protein